jgi:hypothetical protein
MVSVATWIVTVVGHAATIAAGEWITAPGEWVNDRTHDLLSGLIRGIDPAYAKNWEDCDVAATQARHYARIDPVSMKRWCHERASPGSEGDCWP